MPTQGRFSKYLAFSMRKAAAVLACLLLLAAGCRGPDAGNQTQRLASMHVSGRVDNTCFSVDDEGVVTLLEYEWGRWGASCTPTLHRMYPDGRVESKEFPTIDFPPAHTVEGNLVMPEGGNRVAYTNVSTFSTRTIEDSRLAELLNEWRRQSGWVFFDSGLVVYPIEVFEELGVYDPSTGRDIDLFEGPQRASVLSVWDDCLITVVSEPTPPYSIYVVTLDGEQKFSLPVPDSYRMDSVEGSALGLVVSGRRELPTHERLPVVEWYSFEGSKKVTYSLPDVQPGDGQAPRIKIIPGEHGEVVVATQPSEERMGEPEEVHGCAYIGYFDADTGEEIYSRSNDQQAVTFYPLEEVGHYYVHPTAYGEKGGGEIALFNCEEKIASMHHSGKLITFTASADGKFFATFTDGTVSVYALKV